MNEDEFIEYIAMGLRATADLLEKREVRVTEVHTEYEWGTYEGPYVREFFNTGWQKVTIVIEGNPSSFDVGKWEGAEKRIPNLTKRLK